MAKKKQTKIDKRTKAYKESQKKLTNDPSLAGTTETLLVEVIEENIQIDITPEDIKLSRLTNQIINSIPKDLMVEIMKLVDCDCVIEAYDAFMGDAFRVSVPMQDEINKFYTQVFKEKLRRTSCSSCMKRRITKVRSHIKNLVEDESNSI